MHTHSKTPKPQCSEEDPPYWLPTTSTNRSHTVFLSESLCKMMKDVCTMQILRGERARHRAVVKAQQECIKKKILRTYCKKQVPKGGDQLCIWYCTAITKRNDPHKMLSKASRLRDSRKSAYAKTSSFWIPKRQSRCISSTRLATLNIFSLFFLQVILPFLPGPLAVERLLTQPWCDVTLRCGYLLCSRVLLEHIQVAFFFFFFLLVLFLAGYLPWLGTCRIGLVTVQGGYLRRSAAGPCTLGELHACRM